MGLRKPSVVVNVGRNVEQGDSPSSAPLHPDLDAKLRAIHKALVDANGQLTGALHSLSSLQTGQYHLHKRLEAVEAAVKMPEQKAGRRRATGPVDEVVVPIPEHLLRRPA